MSEIIATIAPVAASPFLGFDNIPKTAISVIDFHGTDDDTIPYDLNRYFCVILRKTKISSIIKFNHINSFTNTRYIFQHNLFFSKHSMGTGPYDTVISWDYYYYLGKPRVMLDWVFSFDCSLEEKAYPTAMDGVDDWRCSVWNNCR